MIAFYCPSSQREDGDYSVTRRPKMKQLVAAVMARREPVLILADSTEIVPLRLADVSMLTLDTGYLDSSTICETIEICVGERPSVTIDEELCKHLDLTDLMTAIRPGATADGAIDALRRFAVEALEDDDDDDGLDRTGRSSWQRSRSSGSTATSTEVIAFDPAASRSGPTIDTVSGYGDAIDWAKALRTDLADLKDGKIGWLDLSSKIRLAGPPGTGKTTFAKTLGNSLGLPVLISSPSNWLEPGYLGDVLKRMKNVFADARKLAPSILFIDEIDGIGTRSSDSEQPHAAYHRNLINQLLMLIDGTGANEGVILIGATNRPGDLDPALVRAGRLETQIDIELPDKKALAGIIAQHVGDSLAGGDAPDPRKPAEAGGSTANAADAEQVTTVRVADAREDTSAKTDAGHVRHQKCEELSGSTAASSYPFDDPSRVSHLAADHDNGVCGHHGTSIGDGAASLFQRLAKSAAGLSGADIERIVRSAKQTARRERRELTADDLVEAFNERHRKLPNALRWRHAVHEAGHVVAHRALGFGEPISAYIDENGGRTIPANIDTDPSENGLSKMLVLLLAGRAAEELVLGQVSAGAGGTSDSDLGRATVLACRMEAQFGFASLLHFSDQEMTRRLQIDRAFERRVRERLDQAYAEAKAALSGRWLEIEAEARKMLTASG